MLSLVGGHIIFFLIVVALCTSTIEMELLEVATTQLIALFFDLACVFIPLTATLGGLVIY